MEEKPTLLVSESSRKPPSKLDNFAPLKTMVEDCMAESTTDEHRTTKDFLFKCILQAQKKFGEMFLFGKSITPAILEIIIRIYHENIMRNVCTEKLKEDRSARAQERAKFMLGILQLKNGDIYMTISEDPYEDEKFNIKIQTLNMMLKNAGFTVKFDEHEIDLQNSLSKSIMTYRTNDDDYELIAERNVPVLPDGFDYTKPITVNLVNSETYLKGRRQGRAFMPFKKTTDDPKVYECNNGSSCVEAKLFSYIYNEGYTFKHIAGFAAYWVSEKLPTAHYMPKYSFCMKTDTIGNDPACSKGEEDNRKLVQMTTQVLSQMPGNTIKKLYKTGEYKKFLNTYKTILQPLALACPGCLLNWDNYADQHLEEFDYTNCKNTAKNITREQTLTRVTRSASKRTAEGFKKTLRRKKSKKLKAKIRKTFFKRNNNKKKNYTYRSRN